jgi:hypothetical protein
MSGKLEVIFESYTGPVYERIKWTDQLKGGIPVGALSNIIGGYTGSGKSMFTYDWWLRQENEQWNKLVKQNGGVWLVTLSKDIEEKIQWLRDSFGEGSNNKKSKWRANWNQLQSFQHSSGRIVDVWLKEDAAMLFKLRWCLE